MKKIMLSLLLLVSLLSCADFVRDNPYDPNNMDYTAPQLISATKGGDEFIEIKWQPRQQGVQEYIIYRSGVEKYELTEIARVTGCRTSFVDSKIRIDSNYYYAVEAVLIGGKASERSNIEEGYITSPIIKLEDKNLENAVRTAIQKPEGDIYFKDVEYLTDLEAKNIGIENLTGIEKLSNLVNLNLEKNNLGDIKPLSSLTKLSHLNLEGNNLQNIAPLSSLTNLKRLCIARNNIEDISPLSSLTELHELRLFTNSISDISPLTALTRLKRLRLYDNQVKDISPLSSLKNLTELYLCGNRISDISALANLAFLTKLDLSNNNICSITSLSSLSKLIELNLNNNNISDISPLIQNKKLSSNTQINLEFNPLSDDARYNLIPSLEIRGVLVYWK